MRRLTILAALFLLAGACGNSGGANTTAPTEPMTTAESSTEAVATTTAVPTTTEAVLGSPQDTNVFASSSGDLRSCFLRTLGSEILKELVDGRQPTPEEEKR